MNETQRVIDDLRVHLQSTDQSRTQQLAGLVQAYGVLCTSANERLRSCDELLRRGLRGEAIRRAQEEPVLLDLVAALDFPEAAVLQDILLFYNLPPPPKPRLDLAEALNQAYAAELPLEDLLRRHRRLALSRAGLRERLAVLRQLAALDRNNPVWAEDLREFSTARLRQLQTELGRSGAEGSAEAARTAELVREVEETSWEGAPAQLVEQVRGAARRVGQKQARARLDVLVAKLNGAMAVANLAEGRALVEPYRVLAKQAGLLDNDPLAARARQVLDWVAQQEKMESTEAAFRTALAALDQALNRGMSATEVERRYREAASKGYLLPEAVVERYNRFTDEADRRRRWREMLILGSVFLFGLVLLVVVLGFFWLRGRTAPAKSLRPTPPSAPLAEKGPSFRSKVPADSPVRQPALS